MFDGRVRITGRTAESKWAVRLRHLRWAAWYMTTEATAAPTDKNEIEDVQER